MIPNIFKIFILIQMFVIFLCAFVIFTLIFLYI